MKHYRRRTEKFLERASSPEEKMAWMEVMKWFDTILDKKHFIKNRNIIGLPQVTIDKLNQEFQNSFFTNNSEFPINTGISDKCRNSEFLTKGEITENE